MSQQPGRLLLSPLMTGAANMSVDQAILQHCQAGDRPTLRFYQWQPATLSLGYFQSIADRDGHAASRDCDVVRRSSGGGAILHDRELTYSLVLPSDFLATAGSSMAVYRIVHTVVVECLAERRITARRHGDEGALPVSCDQAGRGSSGQPEPFLCFQRRSAEDLVVHGYKILGSAQRKGRHGVLQHGSLLLAAATAAPELPGLWELTSVRLDIDPLVADFAAKLGDRLGVQWQEGEMSKSEKGSLTAISTEKYASLSWIHKR